MAARLLLKSCALSLFGVLLAASGCPGTTTIGRDDAAPRVDSAGGDATAGDSRPSTCGNRVVEPPEQCDDGNEDNGDQCLDDCRAAHCGDGFVRRGIEECDDGNKDDGDACDSICHSSGFRVNQRTDGDQRHPRVALLADDTIVVVWDGPDDDERSIMLRRFDSRGIPLDAADVPVPTTTAGVQRDADVAANGQDAILVVWADWSANAPDTSGGAVRARSFDAGGNASGPDFVVNSTTAGTQSAPSVCALPDDGFAVVFNDVSGSGSNGIDLRAAKVGADGSVAADALINTSIQGDQSTARVAARAGQVQVVWQAWGAGDDGKGIGIAARLFDTNLVPLSGEFIVNSVTTGNQENPAVAATSAGFVAAWEDGSKGDGDDTKQIRWRALADGQPLAADARINTATAGDQWRTAVAARGDRVAIVWQDASQPSNGFEIRARRLEGGVPTDAADVRVNTLTALDQVRPAVALAADGTAVVVYESSSTTTGYDIRLRLLAPDGG